MNAIVLTYTTDMIPFSLDNKMFNMAIGNEGKIPYRFPEDMKRFRKLTEEGILIYGRKTLDSFPDGKPLPNRENWMLSTQEIEVPGVRVFHSLEEILSALADLESTVDVWVIGGASVYEQLLPYCTVVYRTITFNNDHPQPADAFFKMPDSFEPWSKSYYVPAPGQPDYNLTDNCIFVTHWNSNVRPLKERGRP